MEVDFSPHFLRKAKKLSPDDRRKLSQKIEWFRESPTDPRLKTHGLTGKLKGLFAFRLSYAKRVTFTFVDSQVALFIDIGPHELVYRG